VFLHQPCVLQEWALAQENNFTFDIPVRINLKGLDEQLLTTFWQHQQQQQQQRVQGSSVASSSTDDCGSNSGSSNGDGTFSSSSSSTDWQQQLHQGDTPPLLDRSLLPSFSDRLLVFHRGVGVATAPGLYLTQKLDLLVDYLLLQPLTDALDAAVGSVRGTAKRLQQQSQQLLSQVTSSQQSTHPQQQHQKQEEDEGSSGRLSRQYSLASAAGASLDHPAARVVVRRSLQTLMPGVTAVLRRFWEPLVLQVREGGHGRGNSSGGRECLDSGWAAKCTNSAVLAHALTHPLVFCCACVVCCVRSPRTAQWWWCTAQGPPHHQPLPATQRQL
jgi:hypothetical protein